MNSDAFIPEIVPINFVIRIEDRNIIVYEITEKVVLFNLKPFLIKDMKPSSNEVKKKKQGIMNELFTTSF